MIKKEGNEKNVIQGWNVWDVNLWDGTKGIKEFWSYE